MTRIPGERISFTQQLTRFLLALIALVLLAAGLAQAGSSAQPAPESKPAMPD